MIHRLDRLFILLESGSSAVTRRAAAKQIGEVQKLHPHELHNLLNRVSVILHSLHWDTRIAASQAVQAILENVPQWRPSKNANIKRENEDGETLPEELESHLSCRDKAQSEKQPNLQHTLQQQLRNTQEYYSFDKFNLQMILENGEKLMGSEGKEFDLAVENEEIDHNERLIKQKAILNEKLGFPVDDLVTLDDVASVPKSEIESEVMIKNAASKQTSESSMSSREINRAKRKARQIQAGSSISRNNSLKEEPEQKKIKTEADKSVSYIKKPVSCPDVTGVWTDAEEWPLEAFCMKLYADLFSPRWEVSDSKNAVLTFRYFNCVISKNSFSNFFVLS